MAQISVGDWRDHLPYGATISVAASQTEIFCATPFAVFSLWREDNSLTRMSKANRLSDTGVSTISYDEELKVLYVGYDNGNLDLIFEEGEFNLSDIKQADLVADKQIYSIHLHDGLAYLACGFGIVVVDPVRREIRDTYYLEGQEDLFRVNDIDNDGNYWYAATEKGIYFASIDDPFLANFESWSKMESLPLADDNYTEVMVFQDKLMTVREGLKADELWYKVLGTELWMIFEDIPTSTIAHITDDENEFVVIIFDDVLQFGSDMELIQTFGALDNSFLRAREAAIDWQGNVWVANHRLGLHVKYDNGFEGKFMPAGPPSFSVRRIDAWNDNIWVASGGMDQTWTQNYQREGLHGLVNGQWQEVFVNAEYEGLNSIYGINDIMDCAVNPLNPNEVFLTTWDDGLVQVIDGEFVENYHPGNSTLNYSLGDTEITRVTGCDFDGDGNLWISNHRSEEPLHLRLPNGSFHSIDVGNEIGSEDFPADIVATREGQLWMILARGGGILVLDYGEDIVSESDDVFRILTNEEGEGGLPNSDVRCIEEDLDAEIWVGTIQGLAVYYSPQAIFESEEFDAQQILITQDGNVQILLETETIQCIEIDGANRKWVGTADSGVYLLSEDGLGQIYHFTAENSPILSNNIIDIAVNHSSGEVFFATEKGIISFMSSATNFVEEIDGIKVFPNPVRPSYEGDVAIDGLAFETDVKVTDIAGNIVYQTTSNGGRAIWNGKNFNGERVNTGVYLIFCTNDDGSTSQVGKVAFIK